MKDRYDATVAKEKRLEAAAQPVVASSAKGKEAEVMDKGKKDGKKRRKNMDEDEDELDVLNSDDDDMEFEDEDVAESKKMKNKPKPKKRKVAVVNEADLKNVEALKEEDEVQEGVIWSDSESD